MNHSKALVNLNFDDGRIDTYTIAYPLLKKYNIPATINVTTGYVEGIFAHKEHEIPVPAMTIEMLTTLASDPSIEIAGHGYWHDNTEEDILTGIQHLKTYIPIQQDWGFASPGTGLTLRAYRKMKNRLKAEGISYVRLSSRYLTNVRLKIFCRKAARLFHSPSLYSYAYKDTLQSSTYEDILYSIPILSSITIGEIRAIIKQAIKVNKTCILMFHSIVENGLVRNTWDYKKSKFEAICQMLNKYQEKGLLKVTTAKQIHAALSHAQAI